MSGRNDRVKKSIIILCLLGDPVLPAGSFDRTGGFNVDMTEILNYWSAFSYPITVITNSSSYLSSNDELLYANIQLHRISMDDTILNNQQALKDIFPQILQETIEYIEQNKICPVFIHSYYWYSGLLALKLSLKYNVKFLHSVVALSIDKKLSNSPNFCSVQYEFENEFLIYAYRIMAISNVEKETLIRFYNCKRDIIIVVGRSVHDAFLFQDHDSHGISNLLLADNEKKWNLYLEEKSLDSWWYQGAFTYIGRIKYEKGIGNIIEAWYQLYLKYQNGMPPLWIVGGHPDTISPLREDFFKRYPKFTKLEKEMKICWWGYLTPSSINTVLLKTSVVVTHSQYEAGGRVIIESLSAGKPVIATPTGFAHDLIRDWKNGFLIPFDEINLLKKRMEHFIKQPLITNPLGENARITFQKATERWNYYENHRRIYEQLYNQHFINPVSAEENVDIQNLVPDFYDKKLLYSWPDYNEVQKYLKKLLIKELESNNFVLTFCPEFSNHSFIWHLEIDKNEYYVKYLYSTFNDIIIWNDYEAVNEMCSASTAYKIVTVSQKVTNIKMHFKQCNTYITECGTVCSYTDLFINYKRILQMIYSFNVENTYKRVQNLINKYTLEQLYTFISDFECNDNKIYNKLKSLLIQLPSTESLAISYGKKFFSHIIYKEHSYYLLPSSSICFAPIGIDAATFLIEILNNNKFLIPEHFYNLLSYAATIFKISNSYLFNLCLLVILLHAKRQSCLYNDHNVIENFSFWEQVSNLL